MAGGSIHFPQQVSGFRLCNNSEFYMNGETGEIYLNAIQDMDVFPNEISIEGLFLVPSWMLRLVNMQWLLEHHGEKLFPATQTVRLFVNYSRMQPDTARFADIVVVKSCKDGSYHETTYSAYALNWYKSLYIYRDILVEELPAPYRLHLALKKGDEEEAANITRSWLYYMSSGKVRHSKGGRGSSKDQVELSLT